MNFCISLIYLLSLLSNLFLPIAKENTLSVNGKIGACKLDLNLLSDCDMNIDIEGDYVLELFVDTNRTWHSDPRNMTTFNALYKRISWRLSVNWHRFDEESNRFKFKIKNGVIPILWSNTHVKQNEYQKQQGSLEFVSSARDLNYSHKYYSFRILHVGQSNSPYTIHSLKNMKYVLDADYFNTGSSRCTIQFWERKAAFVPRDNQEWSITQRGKGRSLMVNTRTKEYPVVEIRCKKDGMFFGACPLPEREGVYLTQTEGKDGASVDFNPIFTKWLLIPVSDLR